jgi:hypothetical protein
MLKDLDLEQIDPNSLLASRKDKKSNKLFSSASEPDKKRNYLVNFGINEDDTDEPVKAKPGAKKNDDFAIDDDDFSEDFGQDKVSDIVVEKKSIPEGVYHATFHKPRCCSYRCVQIFRLVSAISLAPVILVSVWLNGIKFFIMYATQWTTLMSLVYFILIYISASKDRALDAHNDQLNAIDDELSANTLNQHSKS